MNRRFVLLLLATAFAGCASFNEAEMTQVRTRGVSPAVVSKLDRGRPVAPADVIELARRGVPDAWVIRQIDDHGVDSYISRSDVTALRRGGVRPAVIDAMVKASDRFEDDYRYRSGGYGGWIYDDPYFGFYGPNPGYWYGGIGATFILPRHQHRHHHRH